MSEKSEIKYFIEELGKKDLVGIFAVCLFESQEESITGKKPPYIAPTVTCIPSEGYSEEEISVISSALRNVAESLRKKHERDRCAGAHHKCGDSCTHSSDCAVHNEPAYKNRGCDCAGKVTFEECYNPDDYDFYNFEEEEAKRLWLASREQALGEAAKKILSDEVASLSFREYLADKIHSLKDEGDE